MSRLLISLAVILASIAAGAQTSQRLTANKTNEYALVYTLPVNAVRVTLRAEKTVRTPGEFFRYAGKYLNLTPIVEPSVSWRLTDAQITPLSVADPDQRFTAQFKNGSVVTMTLTPEGFPVAINDVTYQPAAPAAPTLEPVQAAPTILELPVARQAVTEDMLRSQSSAKRAELAAAKIYEIRQQRADIISGQADNMPSDGAAMKLALDNLADQEAALTAMFVGTTSVSSEVRSFTYTPAASGDAKVVIARLSALDGIVDADDLSGAPVYLDVKVLSRAKLPVNDKGEEKTFPKGGVAYRIPGEARFTVTFDGADFASADMPVAQLGVVFGIDPALFYNKKAPAYLRFDPATGASVEIGQVSEVAE